MMWMWKKQGVKATEDECVCSCMRVSVCIRRRMFFVWSLSDAQLALVCFYMFLLHNFDVCIPMQGGLSTKCLEFPQKDGTAGHVKKTHHISRIFQVSHFSTF